MQICANQFFRLVKNAEEETKLIENATPKSTREVGFENIVPWKDRMVEKNPVLEPCVFTTDKS